LKTFELGTFQKSSNNSRNVFNVRKLFIGINAEIEKLPSDKHLVTEYLASEEIFAIYPMGTHGFLIFKFKALSQNNFKFSHLLLKRIQFDKIIFFTISNLHLSKCCRLEKIYSS
jgi:hypothetical protein